MLGLVVFEVRHGPVGVVGNTSIPHAENANIDFTGFNDPKTLIHRAARLGAKVLHTTDDGLKLGQGILYGTTVELQIRECRAYEYR